MLGHRYFPRVAPIEWKHSVKNDHARHPLLGADYPPVAEKYDQRHLRWLEQFLRTPVCCLVFRTAFARAGQD